jgi:hypothetical protein
MRKLLLIIAALYSAASFSQVTKDSISMGSGNPSYPLDVYYNLTTGAKDTVRNTNWHLSFAVRSAMPPMNVARAAAVRINEARGVNVYMPSTSRSWNNFDTAGWRTWTRPHDSDSSWDIGAFNQGYNVQAFNFGWGNYSMTTRDIDGTKTFLIRIANGPNSIFKKFRIEKLVFDTLWYAVIANLDGTDSNAIFIDKSDFQGKLFAYYNITTNTVIDREPSTPWHLLWSRYFTKVNAFGIDTFYTVTGILQHPTVVSTKFAGFLNDSLAYEIASPLMTNRISNIGWDWKVSPQGPPSTTPWELIDSLSFFVKTQGMVDTAFKIIFTKFTGPNPQITVFNKSLVAKNLPPVGLARQQMASFNVNVFPNPANTALEYNFNTTATTANITVYDITGKMVESSTISKSSDGFSGKIDVSTYNKGMYFIHIQTNEGTKAVRFMVN